MTSELSNFAARLRKLIAASIPAGDDDAVSLTRNSERGTRDINFSGLALELFALQFAANPAYRKICEARRATPRTVPDWRQIPAVPTAAFKELELTGLALEQRTRVFYSSGTTAQQPSRHFHNAESLAVYEDALWAWFARHVAQGINETSLLLLTPPPAQAPHSSLVHMFDVVGQKLSAGPIEFSGAIGSDGAWTLKPESITKQLENTSRTGEPMLILGTAFSFVHLLDHLVERSLRFQLPAGSRVMETGGYKGRSREIPKSELHALITHRLGVSRSDIICEYGMSELSSQAYDSALDASRITHHEPRSFHFPPWARVQIISPKTGREVADGETGLIRVFDLANVFSVMAVQTEDLAVRRGDGFELLGRAVAAEPRGCSLMTV